MNVFRRLTTIVTAGMLALVLVSCGSNTAAPASPTSVTATLSLACAPGGADCAGVNVGDTVAFVATGAGTTGRATLDFGDGATQTIDSLASAVRVPHVYDSTGTFTARLSTTVGNEALSASQLVRVGPVVAATVMGVDVGDLAVLATAEVRGASVALYEWFFDGAQPTFSTTLNQVRFTYPSKGFKDFSVRITLIDGRVIRASAAVVIE